MTSSCDKTAVPKRDKATSVVSVRLTAPERRALSLKANECQMLLSVFMRACALGTLDVESGVKSSRPKPKRLSNTDRQQIALVLASMAQLMECIRDFETLAPDTKQDQSLMLASLKREIATTRDHCFKAVGRLP